MKWRPSGSSDGNRWLNSFRAASSVVTADGVPPVAAIWNSGPVAAGAKTIVFDGVHAPPRAEGVSQRTSLRPPAAAIVLSFAVEKNPMRLLSGD